MSLLRNFGPPAPPPLITAQDARRSDQQVRVGCAFCVRYQVIDARGGIPETFKAIAIGELWLQGRFKCGECRRAATSIEVLSRWETPSVKERWSLDERFAAERLRRWWRHSEGGGRGRNWARFFGRDRAA